MTNFSKTTARRGRRSRATFAFCLFAFCLVSAPFVPADENPPAAPPVVTPSGDAALTPAELAASNELRDLVADGDALLTSLAKTGVNGGETLPQAEKERRVKTILARYERLVDVNPDHLEALLLYGKFLRAVGERDTAFRVFLHADHLSPDLAVVKHQLGAHLAEDGKYADALPLFRRAIELAPSEPRYRYDYGEFLVVAGDELAMAGKLDHDEFDRLHQENFSAASRLKPTEAGYRWRAAEAYYDVKKPDAKAALAAWDVLLRDAGSPEEKEVIGLHRARWLITLGRIPEARKLIAASTTPALDATRLKLLDRIQTADPTLGKK